ncbi:MAG: 8-amino-7-oxononanoate synthase [Polyangiales bacterium]
MTSFSDRVLERLHKLDAAGLRRRSRRVEGPQGPRVSLDGRRVLCLCSNDYLGLAGHPALLDAVKRAIDADGLGSGGPRHISGNMSLHGAAEEAIAAFVRQPSGVLFATGYACNVGTVQALVEAGDVVFSDRLNHASLIDGARLSRARVVVYDHADPDDLRAKLRAHRAEGRGALVITESLFSMDGDIAPLGEVAALAGEFDAGLLVDEAHALGVLGPDGRGLAADQGVVPDVTIGTLGKAFGSQGAFAMGAEPVVDLVRNRARSYVFSTAPWPALGAAALAALPLVREADAPRALLRQHWRRLRDGLGALGYHVIPGDSAIIPVVVGDADAAMALSRKLYERGVFVHGIRPPTVPAGTSRLRVVPMASHTSADIEEALVAFAEVST